jgi:hypothetical protein
VVPQTKFVLTGLKTTQLYGFKVSVTNIAGVSLWSGLISLKG